MKYKIFTICILTGLFIPLLALVSCNPKPEKTEGVKLGAKLKANIPDPRKQDPPKPGGGATDPNGEVIDPNGEVIDPNGGAADQQDEAAKQTIINDLTPLIIPSIKRNINTHNNATWNEGTQNYNISGATQFFGAIQYTDAKKQKKLYNTQDDESKTARREMYLGFGYDDLAIEAFGKLASKMAATKNVQMETELENMVDKIRQYARAYYLIAFNTLINKKDKLMELALSDLQILKARFDAIHTTKSTISYNFTNSISNDYNLNIEVGTADPKHTLQDNATAEEIQDYLKDKFTPAESDFDTIINEATKITGILNKIQ
ncbi:hypothetical protein bhYOR_001072 (plasmid) [Borrelia nietonii YOR]|uniref:virulence associated lipoprotein n=1 Tax=Borrelia nietonii TaxID=3117462 RepID=UPI00046D7DDB|nr:virulence associated lipoprotein [Borrelia nietonii]UPA09767.1 hypothetical protein bhYOR_001072 [Borrelia nietonii YOR]